MMFDWVLAAGFTPYIIATKSDKIKRSQIDKQKKLLRETLQADRDTVIIPFSAETKAGREELWEKVEEIVHH